MKYIHYSLFIFILSMSACSEETLLKEEIETTNTIPVNIQIGTTEAKTKTAPPDGIPTDEKDPVIIGSSLVDKVRIVAFKRILNDTGSFTYDSTNDQVVNCAIENGVRVARGIFTKTMGYDYRVIAFGYSQANNESNKFNLTAVNSTTTYDEFKLSIVAADTTIQQSSTKTQNVKKIRKPELFYGYCHSGDGNEVITGTGLVQLTGVLYRCMGKVTVTINNVSDGAWKFHWFTLLAETIYSQSLTTNYEAFKTPFTRISSSDSFPWVVIDMKDLTSSGNPTSSPGNVTLSAFLLPTQTKLRIRMKSRLGLTDYFNEYAVNFTDISSAENATGVISTTSNNNTLFIRRNKNYTITGDYKTIVAGVDQLK